MKEAYITKTRLYNFDPLKPHFNIVKLGFIGVYYISNNELPIFLCERKPGNRSPVNYFSFLQIDCLHALISDVIL